MTDLVREATSQNVPANDPVRVGWVTFSPMPYQVPLYRLLAADPRIDLTVIYLSRDGLAPHDVGYGEPIIWDVDLCSGYHWEFASRANEHQLGQGPLHFHDLDVVRAVGQGRFEVLVLHGYSTVTHQLAALAQLSLRRPLFFREEQTLLAPRPLWKTAIKTAWLRPIFKRSRALCIGTENERWFARFGVPDSRRVIVPYAADDERLRRDMATQPGGALWSQLDLPAPNCPVILAVGRLVPQKGPLILLRAYERVRARMPCILLYVGSGPLRQQVENEARANGVPDVHVVGFLGPLQIARAYAAADLLVLPSAHNEPWGMVVNEAMHCGLPVVVSHRVGSSTDLVHDDINGYVVEAGDTDALAHAIERIAASPERRRRFGEASRTIIGNWTHRHAAAAVLGAVSDAVGSARWDAARAGQPEVPGSLAT